MSAISVQKGVELNLNALNIVVNKRLYIDKPKYDWWRKAVLPLLAYIGIGMVGRSDPYERKTNEDGKVIRCKCGSYHRSYICDCEKTVKSKINYCYRSQCRVCFHKAIQRQSKRIIERLEKIEKLEGVSLKLSHYTFNITNDLNLFPIVDIASFKKYKLKLIRILKKYGFDGVLIFHPFSKDKELSKKMGVPVAKKWAHFHAVGRFKNLPDGGVFYRKHNFTYKNISYDNWKKENSKVGKMSFSEKANYERFYELPYIKDVYNIRSVLTYILSHASVLGSRMKNFSYVGGFSPYHYKKINEKKEWKPVVCEECNSNLFGIKKSRWQPIDGLTCKLKNYKKIRVGKIENVHSVKNYVVLSNAVDNLIDIYEYDRTTLEIDKNDILMSYEYTYDLIDRKDYVKPLERKLQKECSTCLFRHVKFCGGSTCIICHNHDKWSVDI